MGENDTPQPNEPASPSDREGDRKQPTTNTEPTLALERETRLIPNWRRPKSPAPEEPQQSPSSEQKTAQTPIRPSTRGRQPREHRPGDSQQTPDLKPISTGPDPPSTGEAEVLSEQEKTTEVPWWYQPSGRGAPLHGDSSLRQTPPHDPLHLDPQPSAPSPTPHQPQSGIGYPRARFDPSQYGREPLGYSPYPRRQQPDSDVRLGPYGAPRTPEAVRRRQLKRRRWIIGGASILSVEAVAVVLGLWKLGFFNSKELDVSKVDAGVQRILTDPIDGYDANNVTAVNCNNSRNPSADKGDNFTCEVTINGLKRHVNVVVQDDNGTYEVDRPR
jgi:hypothetical protein